jgi:MFS family permease
VRDLVEGAHHLVRSPVARGIAVVMGLVLFLAGWQVPFQLTFVQDVLAPGSDLGARAAVMGLLTGAWGTGMVIGSLGAPLAARRLPLERVLAASIATAGLAMLAGSRSTAVGLAVIAWVVGGIGSGVANVAYETLLQQRTPDRFRGRVLSAVEAIQEGTFFLGALSVGAFGGSVTPAVAIGLMGLGFVAIGLATIRLLPLGTPGETGGGVITLPDPAEPAWAANPVRATAGLD